MDNSSRVDDGGTLTAIGRALLQMQQGGAQNQQLSLPSSTNSQQIFLTRASSISESSTVAPNAGCRLFLCLFFNLEIIIIAGLIVVLLKPINRL